MKNLKLYVVLMLVILASCGDYLEYKPDIKLTVPKSLSDADLLLNDYTSLNTVFPVVGELGTDEYYLTDDRWDAIGNDDQRRAYYWADIPYTDATQWQQPYKVVYIANQVIDILSKLDEEKDEDIYRQVLGAAYFYRAFAFQQILEVYGEAYNPSSAHMDLGIPLRLSAGIDERSTRSSVKDCYNQIIRDYEVAESNLSLSAANRGRPNKAAACAGMARAYLTMQDYERAYMTAVEGLKFNNELMDYNALSTQATLPIPRFNPEVLFSATTVLAVPMSYTSGLVDQHLIELYEDDDLRLKFFFEESTDMDGAFVFRGSYDNSFGRLFVGFTTSELYLIKAEAAARTERIEEALTTINVLRKSRWDKNAGYVGITEQNAPDVLTFILQERRRELAFRGRRWIDLKRLNQDPKYSKTITRQLKGRTYQLLPQDLRYAYRLPEPVIEVGMIQQNKR